MTTYTLATFTHHWHRLCLWPTADSFRAWRVSRSSHSKTVIRVLVVPNHRRYSVGVVEACMIIVTPYVRCHGEFGTPVLRHPRFTAPSR